jgi:hypothetical protein
MLARKNLLLLLLILAYTKLSFGQSLKTIMPTIGAPINYSNEEQILWQSILDKYSKINSGDLVYDTLNVTEKSLLDSLEMGGGH